MSGKRWAALFSALLIIFALAAAAVYFAGGGDTVTVTSDGSVIYEGSLFVSRVLQVENGDGGYNTVCIEGGEVWVSEASCPDHICVEQGHISDGIVPIVCLPNRLVVRVSGGESVDGAVGQ